MTHDERLLQRLASQIEVAIFKTDFLSRIGAGLDGERGGFRFVEDGGFEHHHLNLTRG